MTFSWAAIAPILMLVASNVFMTFAWYGHLKIEHRPLWLIVAVSWLIALPEYCLAVPANRIGRVVYDPAELKAMQEVVTLVVFAVFAVTYLGERLTVNHAIGFGFIALGAWFVFKGPF
ncbi:MAG TPA: DMT family protein [Phenylobacterium sp.]